jgi:hypothetical protein
MRVNARVFFEEESESPLELAVTDSELIWEGESEDEELLEDVFENYNEATDDAVMRKEEGEFHQHQEEEQLENDGLAREVVPDHPLASSEEDFTAFCGSCTVGLRVDVPLDHSAISVVCEVCSTANVFQLCWTCPAIIEKDAMCPKCLEKFGGKELKEVDIRIGIGKDEDDEEAQCPICLEGLKKDIAVLNCGHMNHLKCFLDWSKAQGMTKASCCLCRGDAPYYKRLASMAELSDLGQKPYFSSNVLQEEQADRFYRSPVPPIPNPFENSIANPNSVDAIRFRQRQERGERNRRLEEQGRRLEARLEEVMNMPSSNNNNNNNNNNVNDNVNDNPLLVEEEQRNNACRWCLNTSDRQFMNCIKILIIFVILGFFVGGFYLLK